MAVLPPLPRAHHAGHGSGEPLEQPFLTMAEGQRASPERTGDKKKFWARLGQSSEKFLLNWKTQMTTHFHTPQILFEL